MARRSSGTIRDLSTCPPKFLHLGGDDGDEFVLHQPHKDLGAGDQDADPGPAQGQHLENGPASKHGQGLLKVGPGQEQGMARVAPKSRPWVSSGEPLAGRRT